MISLESMVSESRARRGSFVSMHMVRSAGDLEGFAYPCMETESFAKFEIQSSV